MHHERERAAFVQTVTTNRMLRSVLSSVGYGGRTRGEL